MKLILEPPSSIVRWDLDILERYLWSKGISTGQDSLQAYSSMYVYNDCYGFYNLKMCYREEYAAGELRKLKALCEAEEWQYEISTAQTKGVTIVNWYLYTIETDDRGGVVMNTLYKQNRLKLYIGICWHTFESATAFANKETKQNDVYYTTICGEPVYRDSPACCWAITNQYDVNVIEFNKGK